MTKSIGIDIGGTNCRIGVFEGLSLLSEIRFLADFSGICKTNSATDAWPAIIDCIAVQIEKVFIQHQEIKHIGIGFPGFIDPKTKVISQSPNLPGLKNVNLTKDLSLRLEKTFHQGTVIVENDALAAAYGEFSMIGHHADSLLYVGLGTGVGGGLIFSGHAYTGVHGMAMEIGHIIVRPNGRKCGCGNLGCVEQYASASAITISYEEVTKQHLSADKIAELARQGDHHAIRAFQIAGESLAIATSHTLKVVDVPTIIIGGGLSQAWDLMQDSFNRALHDNLIPVLRGKPQITLSTIKDKAGMLGAAMLAVNTTA